MPPDLDPELPTAPKTAFGYSFRAKLTALVALLVALTTVALTVTDYRYVRDMLRDSVRKELTLHGEAVGKVLVAYVDQQHERAALVASRTRLRQMLGLYYDGDFPASMLQGQAHLILLDAQRSTSGFLAIHVASRNGKIVATTDTTALGRDVSRDAAFIQGRTSPFLGIPERKDDQYRAMLSVPARTNDGVELGVVMVDLDVAPMIEILDAISSGHASTRIRLGAWIAPGQARYLFPATGLGDDANDDPAMLAALGGESGFDTLEDYHGKEVLASYQPVGYRDWALVVHVDTDEAYAPIGDLLGVVLLTAIAFFAFAALGAMRIARSFSQPIMDLVETATAIESGDLSVRANVATKDELGLLGHAFNTMTNSLERHRNHLEELVQQRTQALLSRSVQLERSRDELAELCRLLEGQADIIEHDLRRAEVIQRSLLPHEPPQIPGFCVQALYRPGHNVGGDLYDVVPIGDRWVAIVIADTAGHGISAAMLAALFMHRLQLTDRQTGRPFRPTEALATINTALIKDLAAPGVFVTAVFCLLDTETRQLVVASAGHPPVLIARADGRVEQIEHTGPALGLYHDSVFGERTVHLNERDQVLLYTDGLFDVAGEIATSRDDIASTLRERQGQPRLLETVLVDVSSGSEREDRDDVTMVLLDASPGRSSFYDSGNAHALAPPDTDQQAVTFAETDDTTFLCLSGRMTWTHGEALLDAASEVVDNDRALIIDLAECEYLDSAMLGTLHELASRAAVAQTSFHVQNASASLKNAFEELSMHIVLERLSAQSVEVPQQRTALQLPPTDPHRQQMRLLAAHEVLADLSEDNQAQFGPVVDAMREDLGR